MYKKVMRIKYSCDLCGFESESIEEMDNHVKIHECNNFIENKFNDFVEKLKESLKKIDNIILGQYNDRKMSIFELVIAYETLIGVLKYEKFEEVFVDFEDNYVFNEVLKDFRTGIDDIGDRFIEEDMFIHKLREMDLKERISYNKKLEELKKYLKEII